MLHSEVAIKKPAVAEPTLNDFLDLIRPPLDKQIDGLRRAVAMFSSEAARLGPPTPKLVEQVLDRCNETFEVGADQTFYTLRRISNITSLDQAQLFQHTIQA